MLITEDIILQSDTSVTLGQEIKDLILFPLRIEIIYI